MGHGMPPVGVKPLVRTLESGHPAINILEFGPGGWKPPPADSVSLHEIYKAMGTLSGVVRVSGGESGLAVVGGVGSGVKIHSHGPILQQAPGSVVTPCGGSLMDHEIR